MSEADFARIGRRLRRLAVIEMLAAITVSVVTLAIPVLYWLGARHDVRVAAWVAFASSLAIYFIAVIYEQLIKREIGPIR